MDATTAPTAYDYQLTDDVPCPACEGDTIPPTPGVPAEQGWYCERCGTCRNRNGEILL